MVLVEATAASEKGVMPTAWMREMLAAMGRFNEELRAAGILLAAEGLTPSSQGKRIDEAVAWARRCPNPMPVPSQIEIRPLYEAADLP